VFFQHLDVRRGHAAVGCFAHVVNGQKANLNGGERFHFNAGGASCFCGDERLVFCPFPEIFDGRMMDRDNLPIPYFTTDTQAPD